jgi:hypothetical protein
MVLPLLSSRDRPAHGRCTRAPSSPLSPSTDTSLRVRSVALRVRVPRSTRNWLVTVSTLRSTLHDQPGPRGTFAGSVAWDGTLYPSQARGNAHLPRVGVAAAGLDAARPLATPAAQRHVRVHGPGASEIRGKAASAGLQKAATSVFGSKATRSRVEFSKSRGSPPQKSRWSPKRPRSLSFSHGSSRPRACARGTCCHRGVCPVGASGGGSRRGRHRRAEGS